MCRKVELLDKRMMLGAVVTQIVPQMMQFQQLHQHQIEVDSLSSGNLSSVQPTLCHLIDFITVQHQVGCESVMLVKKDVLVLNGQKLVQGIPNIIIRKTKPLGHYGRLRKAYLEMHRPILFNELVLSDKLFEHCAEIDEAARNRIELIVRSLVEQNGVTEQLKAENQMEWVRQMNACKAQAEEVVKAELIYD